MRIKSKKKYWLPVSDVSGTELKRWLHLATVVSNTREFMCFADAARCRIYLEEVVGGHLEMIDEGTALELNNFLISAGILDMTKPLIPDEE